MKKRILIIDDDESILGACELTLMDAGYDVRTIEGDGNLVKRQAHEIKPDMIILDLFLSKLDGKVIAKELKSNDQTKHIPIILVSGSSEVKDVAKEVLVENYLSKPFELKDFMSMVERYI